MGEKEVEKPERDLDVGPGNRTEKQLSPVIQTVELDPEVRYPEFRQEIN